jgi:alkylation response protein AidB-like acyl-CoA dehydrogenase
MDLHLTEEQDLLLETVKKFAAERITPHATGWSREAAVPKAIVDEVAALGVLGLELDPDTGGAGMGLKELALVTEALGVGDAGLALGILMHGIAGWAYEAAGHDATEFAMGETLGAVSWGHGEPVLAESSADERWNLNGQRAAATWIDSADHFLVEAVTEGANESALFSVARDAAGLVCAGASHALGFRSANLGSLTLNDTPATLLSRDGAHISGVNARIQLGLAAVAVGIGHAAMDAGRRYAAERKQFGKPIASFQAIQFKLADMVTEVEAGRLLVWRAADVPRTPGVVAMARLYAGEASLRAANECLQIHGGYGFTEEFVAERLYRDAQLAKILAGSSQSQRISLAQTFLDRP